MCSTQLHGRRTKLHLVNAQVRPSHAHISGSELGKEKQSLNFKVKGGYWCRTTLPEIKEFVNPWTQTEAE